MFIAQFWLPVVWILSLEISVFALPCPDADQRSRFIEQACLDHVDGMGGSCGRPDNTERESTRPLSKCEEQREQRLEIQRRGMKHLLSTLTSEHRPIEIGGYWTIRNSLWNPATNTRCDLRQVPGCRPEVWTRHHIRQLSCFENESQALDWSQQVLNTKHQLQRIIPNHNSDLHKLLPFPDLFNVTVIDFRPTQVCRKSNPIACHRQMSLIGDQQCSFFVCHSTNSGKLYKITYRYEPKKIRVTMLMMCHPLTSEEKIEYKSNDDDQLCHFTTPQTSFFLCDDQK